MVPDFLLADTNPKAAGIFCLLLLLASHPCRALRSTHWLSQSHTHIFRHAQMNTWWTINIRARIGGMCSTMYAGDITRTVLISTLPPSSPSALYCGNEKKTNKLAHLLSWYCSLRQTCPRTTLRCPHPSVPVAVSCWRLQHSLDVLAVAWHASGVVGLFMFVSEDERCSLESTCATQRVTLQHDRASLLIKDKTQI